MICNKCGANVPDVSKYCMFCGNTVSKLNYYNNDNGIDVKWSKDFIRFCQFTNGPRLPEETLIKLYIPLDKKHLREGAILIFNYIENLGIDHESKIADEIRSDNIVIRLKKTDADKAMQIIDFH